MHRDQLREAAQQVDPPAHLLAFNWLSGLPQSTIHRICSDRILERGDKHQSLIADTAPRGHEDVLWMFLKQAEEPAEAEADVLVTLNIDEDLEHMLARAVDACVEYLGVERPDQEKIGEALAAARAYEPKRKGNKTKAAAKRQDDKPAKPPRYFGVLAEVGLEGVVGPALAAAPDVPDEARKVWTDITAGDRVAQRPHITIVHSNSLPDEQALWDACMALHTRERPPVLSFRLEALVWNGRIMAAAVSDLAVASDDPGEVDEKAVALVATLPKDLRERLHVTVGTRDKIIQPVEARDLVAKWRRNGAGPGVWSIPLKDVWVKGRLKGLFN